MNKLLVPAFAGALYTIGLAVHELTHVLACWVFGCRVERIHLYPPAVDYYAPNTVADGLVKSSTVLLSVPIFVVYGLWLLADPWSYRLLGIAAMAGYLPRSESDWGPLTKLFK